MNITSRNLLAVMLAATLPCAVSADELPYAASPEEALPLAETAVTLFGKFLPEDHWLRVHAESVARRLRRDGYVARTVVLKLKLGRRRGPGARGYPLLTRQCPTAPASSSCRSLATSTTTRTPF